MPDAAGNFKGQGWSARKAAAWERVFKPEARKPAEAVVPSADAQRSLQS